MTFTSLCLPAEGLPGALSLVARAPTVERVELPATAWANGIAVSPAQAGRTVELLLAPVAPDGPLPPTGGASDAPRPERLGASHVVLSDCSLTSLALLGILMLALAVPRAIAGQVEFFDGDTPLGAIVLIARQLIGF